MFINLREQRARCKYVSVMDNGFTFKAALRETSKKIDKIAAMVAARNGEVQPIEWLESSRTQWIDTGIFLSSDAVVEIKFMRKVKNEASAVFGISGFSGGQTLRLYDKFFQRNGYDAAHSASVPSDDKWHVLRSSATEIVVDGVLKSGSFAGTFSPGTLTLFCQRSSASTTNVPASCRISYFRLHNSGVLVRDFVPVRIGTVGYMLDFVSGKLFGNKGTGSFVLGPDL